MDVRSALAALRFTMLVSIHYALIIFHVCKLLTHHGVQIYGVEW